MVMAKKKKNKITIADKALANAVKKGEISYSDLPKNKKLKTKKIIDTSSDTELENASKNKYKHSKRKVKHVSKNKKNESMKEDRNFKKIITDIEEWEDSLIGGKADGKTPSDFDIDALAAGAEIEMEHTDDPEIAIELTMDHIEEVGEDYYDEEEGLPAMERRLKGYDNDDDDDDDDYDDDDYKEIENEITSDDEYFDDDEKINDMKMENAFIKKFSKFSKINESDEPTEPKMYPKENKFKRVMEYADDIEQSLIEHNFNKLEGEGGFIIFDMMDKSYQLVGEMPTDIRPCAPPEFDHMMDNL